MNANRVPVADDQKGRSYYKYYLAEMAEVPQKKLDLLLNARRDPLEALDICDRNKLFDPGYLPCETGYSLMPDGSIAVANLTGMKGVTGAMLQWWFAWHGIEPLRYAIWDPYDHYGLKITDTHKAYILDRATSVPDKCRNVDHLVSESLVPGEPPVDIMIHFKSPADMGFDTAKLFTEACSFLVCANCEILAPDGGRMPIVMTHMARDTADGCELRSRFWLGYNIIDGEATLLLPRGAQIPEPLVVDLLSHNFLEYANLAQLLPKVYAEEKDNWA